MATATTPVATALDRLLPDRIVGPVRAVLVLGLVAGAAFYVFSSIHWPIIWDSAVMHYVNFLIDHGLKPYSEITDSNMPGAYLSELWAMRIFGAGDLGWRIFDFALLLALTLASIVITRPYDWLAGFYAGLMFTLLHASEGPNFAGEREQVMTVLLLIGLACLLSALRLQRPLLMLPFGLSLGMASSIKPTSAPLAILLLLLVAALQRRRHLALAAFLLWAIAGLALTCAVVLGFLLHFHAMADFLFVTRSLLPSYVALRHVRLLTLARVIVPHNMLLLLPFVLGIAWLRRGEHTLERSLLLVGVAFGAFSYFAQRKGFIYHRYPFVTFLLLWFGLELVTGLRRRGVSRALAFAGIALTLVVSIPHYLLTMRRAVQVSAIPMSLALYDDLARLPETQLQGKVQCFDLTYGCFSALYRLGLLQDTGFTGDLLFFSPTDSPAVQYYRAMFWRLARQDPADVLVLSDQWLQSDDSYNKLNTWPEFVQYLNSNYSLVLARRFSPDPDPPGHILRETDVPQPPAYRIYLRRSSPHFAADRDLLLRQP